MQTRQFDDGIESILSSAEHQTRKQNRRTSLSLDSLNTPDQQAAGDVPSQTRETLRRANQKGYPNATQFLFPP
jgi:hypothetical protein